MDSALDWIEIIHLDDMNWFFIHSLYSTNLLWKTVFVHSVTVGNEWKQNYFCNNIYVLQKTEKQLWWINKNVRYQSMCLLMGRSTCWWYMICNTLLYSCVLIFIAVLVSVHYARIFQTRTHNVCDLTMTNMHSFLFYIHFFQLVLYPDKSGLVIIPDCDVLMNLV